MAKPYATDVKTLQNAAAATGNGEPLRLNGLGSVGFQVAGTFVGEITFEARQTTWVPIQCFNMSTGAVSTLATAPGMYVGFAANAVEVQARISDYTSGAITVTAMASQGAGLSLADIDVETGEIIGVTGTFWQTTQPVSIATMPSTPVTGAFYPDTQPVSLATAPSTPVTGTFYPETQPVSIATAPALVASEAHVGEIGGNSITVVVTPTITAGAEHANDVLGGIQTITAAARAANKPTTLDTLVIRDLAMQDGDMVIWFFNANPSNGTYTDNAALDIHDTDLAMCVGWVDVLSSDYKDAADNSVATLKNIGLKMTPVGTANLFAIAQLKTATKTYASTTDLSFVYVFGRD